MPTRICSFPLILQTAGWFSLCLAAGCSRQPPPGQPAEAATTGQPVPVRMVLVEESQTPQTTVLPATLHAYYSADIRARATGYVRELLVDIGDRVRAGDRLLELDVPELHKQREVLQARLARFEAQQGQAAAGVALARARVQAAEARVAESRSQLGRIAALLAAAEAEFARTSDLVERRSLENRLLDEARKRRDAEAANEQAMTSSIQSAQAEVVVAQAELDAAAASLQAAEAETDIAGHEVQELDVRIGYATLVAPFDGVVLARNVSPGDLVQAHGQASDSQPLLVLQQTDKLRVHVYLPEAHSGQVAAGETLKLTLPAFPGDEPCTAVITRLAGGLNASTRSRLIEAELPNADGRYLPGMFGQAEIQLAPQLAGGQLPARAVRFNEKGEAFVYLVQAGDQVAVVPVQTGWDDGQRVQLLSGVEPGQAVIDAHLQRFQPGDRVHVLAN